MNSTKTRCEVQRGNFGSSIEFLVSDGRAIGLPVTFQETVSPAYIEPTFKLTPSMAQELMDGLWSCGLRPSEGSGSAGALRATEKHLEDMRAIAFDQLNLEDH